MTKKELLFIWFPSITIIGFATGYLFSSRFCKVSIQQRVQTQVSINDQLRQEWTAQAFSARQAIIALTNNTPDAEVLSTVWLVQQDTLFQSLSQYLSAHLIKSIQEISRKNVQDIISAVKANSEPLQTNQFQTQATKLAEHLARISPALASYFKELEELFARHYQIIVEQINARRAENWQVDAQAASQFFANCLEIANELDTAFIKQLQNRL